MEGASLVRRPAAGSAGAVTQKKNLQALEQKRQDVADLRRNLGDRQTPALHWPTIWKDWPSSTRPRSRPNMAKTTGWAPRGQRLVDHAPFGHWRTQTFIGALRHDRLDSPWVIDGAMNSEMSTLYVTTQLVPPPTLRSGDVVILDNLVEPQEPRAARALRDIGTWLLFPAAPTALTSTRIEMGLLEAQGADQKSCRPNLS